MPLPRFQKLDEDRKRTILRAAAQEFAELGFERASFNRIIERAGVSKGAMYYYFADKDDLFCTVLEVAEQRWLQEVGYPFAADTPRAFWDACEAMYARSLRFMLSDPLDAALCLSMSTARAEAHPKALELRDSLMAWTLELAKQGQRLGAVRDDIPIELLAHAGHGVIEATDRWLAERWDSMSEQDVVATAHMMIELFRGLGEKRP